MTLAPTNEESVWLNEEKNLIGNKPIGALPGRNYVLTRMVIQII